MIERHEVISRIKGVIETYHVRGWDAGELESLLRVLEGWRVTHWYCPECSGPTVFYYRNC